MEHVNLLKVALAALSGFMLGGLWYSPVMFLPMWAREKGIELGEMNKKGRHPAFVFISAYVFAFFGALFLAMLLGPNPTLGHSLCWSLTVGVVFVGGSYGINYLFGGESFKYWLVNGGYHIIQYLLYGLVFGLWH